MIHVKDEWYIDADENEFVLKRKTERVDKTGKVVFTNNRYFNNVENALKSLLKTYQREYVRGHNVELMHAYKKFDELTDEFLELINTSPV